MVGSPWRGGVAAGEKQGSVRVEGRRWRPDLRPHRRVWAAQKSIWCWARDHGSWW